MSDVHIQHKLDSSSLGTLQVAVVTVSDSRTAKTDKNASYLKREIEAASHEVAASLLVKDEAEEILQVLDDLLADSKVQVILFNGGTGVSRRDTTFDVLTTRLEKALSGFGELFRMLSYEQIGSAAMLSRATAGTIQGKVVFLVPGSPKAVQLAWEKLICPELTHLVWEASHK